MASCDSDYNELGADIIGSDSFEVGEPETFTVKASQLNFDAVESSDLPVNALGIYKDPVFGQTKASLVIQPLLTSFTTTFSETLHPTIDSVVLYVPYFCTRKGYDTATSVSTYELDSIYGKGDQNKISLKVYESNYFIQNTDPASTTGEQMKYYSDQRSVFDNAKGAQLNQGAVSQNEEFFFNPNEIREDALDTNGNTTTTRKAPGLRMFLNKTFFENKIIHAPADKLTNNSVFKEYFRGLYFSVENSGSFEGNLSMINIKGGNITIYYHQLEEAPSTANPTPDNENKTMVLSLNGRSVNFLEYQNAITNPDANMLYLKGGQGSMALIDLFGRDQSNGNTAELTELRNKKWLVNDASLTFRINRNKMASTNNEPNRIYLYDFTNNRPIADYNSDLSAASNPKFAKSTFGGIIKKQDERGYEYKIRLTNYIRALLKNNDSTNVRLGLVVTESIADVSNKKLKTANSALRFSQVPSASVMNPLGTIIYGSDASNGDDRIKFKIYFTKPKQN